MHFFLFKINFCTPDSHNTLHSPLNKDDFCQKSSAFVVAINYFIQKNKRKPPENIMVEAWCGAARDEETSSQMTLSTLCWCAPGSAPG